MNAAGFDQALLLGRAFRDFNRDIVLIGADLETLGKHPGFAKPHAGKALRTRAALRLPWAVLCNRFAVRTKTISIYDASGNGALWD